MLEQKGACVTADYALNADGTISVTNTARYSTAVQLNIIVGIQVGPTATNYYRRGGGETVSKANGTKTTFPSIVRPLRSAPRGVVDIRVLSLSRFLFGHILYRFVPAVTEQIDEMFIVSGILIKGVLE